MSIRLEIAAWLATHYTYTAESRTLRLDRVLSKCLKFFKKKGLRVHTAQQEVTSLISILFHVPLNTGSDISTREKYIFIPNVKPIPDSTSSTVQQLQLPVGCRLITTPDKEIQFMCPFYPSGDRNNFTYCTIGLQWHKTILSFDDYTVSLDIQLRLQTDRINGLISLVRQLRSCNGTGVTIVNTGGDTKAEHAEKCERIILPLSRETCCESCVDLKLSPDRMTNIGLVVKTGQIEHTGIAENTSRLDKKKNKGTELDFASNNELHEQRSVSDRDNQHVLEDPENLFEYCNVELGDHEYLNEQRGAELPMIVDSSTFPELDSSFITNGLSISATLGNKLMTEVFAEANQTKWQDQKQTSANTTIDDYGAPRENSGTVMIEDRNNGKMTYSDCQSEKKCDTNMNNDIDDFEILKPRSDLVLLQSSTHSPEILKTLLRMQRENKYCDFKLVTPYKIIHVHKLIILANSPSFLKNHGCLDNVEELHFPEVLPSVLDSVVYFLYTGKLKVKKSEIILLKSFCETEGLKSALELLHEYSDVETLSLTVEQLMGTSNPHSKGIIEKETANTSSDINEDKAETTIDIVKQLEAETEKECSVVTKSGRLSKPTSLKVAVVLAQKRKTKMKSLMSEIKSKGEILKVKKSKNCRKKRKFSKSNSREHMLNVQKGRNFRSKGTNLKRNSFCRGSVNMRQNRSLPSKLRNNKKRSDFTESRKRSKLNQMVVSEKFDPYHFHSYALSISHTTDSPTAANDDNNDGDKNEDNNGDQFETDIDGRYKINGQEKKSKERKVKQKIKPKSKLKERVQCQCSECGKVMYCKRQLQKHMAEMHRDKESLETYKHLTCDVCGKIVTTYRQLARHVINKHGNKDPKNVRLVEKETCSSCGLVLPKIADRIRHETKQHGMQNESQLTVNFQCTHCEKEFATQHSLHFHEFKCHGVVSKRRILPFCKVEGCNYVGRDSYSLECHMQYRHSNAFSYSCEFCGKGFKVASDVDRHVKKNHTCRICEKKVSSKQELMSHISLEHSIEEVLEYSVDERFTLQCDICSQRYMQKDRFYLHLYNRHNRPLPKGLIFHHCDKCRFVTNLKCHLEKHKQTHKGAAIYTCKICHQVFSNKAWLTKHYLRLHKPGEAKSNVCHICSKNFKTDKQLQLHLYEHHGQQLPDVYSWYKCDSCSFVAVFPGTLEAHTKKVHSGSIVYTCSVCQKAFNTIGALKSHLHKHKGAICPQRSCPVICESEAELVTHMKQEHEGEKAVPLKKKGSARPVQKTCQNNKPEPLEKRAESGCEVNANVEYHDTNDDCNEDSTSKTLSIEVNNDVAAPNKISAITYELRHRNPRNYQHEFECDMDQDSDDTEGSKESSEYHTEETLSQFSRLFEEGLQ